MAGRRVDARRPTPVLQAPAVKDATTQRALDSVIGAVQELQATRNRSVIEGVNLDIGVNRITHNLGRPVIGYHVTATDANIAFAHAIDKTNPVPEREIWIEVVGSGQDDVTIEVY